MDTRGTEVTENPGKQPLFQDFMDLLWWKVPLEKQFPKRNPYLMYILIYGDHIERELEETLESPKKVDGTFPIFGFRSFTVWRVWNS